LQSLEDAYRKGVEPDLERLRELAPHVAAGDATAIVESRGICHRLKGSGSSYGHPEVTAVATEANHAADGELGEVVVTLVSILDEIVVTNATVSQILMVDDDPLMRAILERTLAAPGRSFVSAASLAEARGRISPAIALVLLDCLLPDGSGLDLLKEIRTGISTPAIPVVVLSGLDDEETRRGVLDAGADAFFTKPFDAAALVDTVNALVTSGESNASEISAGSAISVPVEEAPPRPRDILLVEDDDLVVALIEDRLSRDGYVVRRHADGESALADALASPPDLVILDVMMPRMNGFEVLERLRSSSATAKLPVIMLTGRAREEDVVHGFDLGATDYIVKPFSPAEVAVRVRRHLAAT